MSKTRRSSFFSQVSMRTVSGSTASTRHEALETSRITRKSHIKIQTTSHGCFCTLFLLVGVPDTIEQTPFPLLADRHIDLHEWHIHSLDAHWAAPALSESAARAAAIFKIPVSTDMALDESEPANTAIVLSSGGNLNLIVPAGAASLPDSESSAAGGWSSGKGGAVHVEHGKRGYLVTLVIEVAHLRSGPEWPLQVSIPVPRCLMNTFEFRISSSDQKSAKDSPIRVYPKLIGINTEEHTANQLSPSPSNPELDLSSIRRCSIVSGPKVKGMFTATSLLSLTWLRSSASVTAPAHASSGMTLRPLRVSQAQIDTALTSVSFDDKLNSHLIHFATTCTLSGLSHDGIEERGFVKFSFLADNGGASLNEIKLLDASSSNSRAGSSKGVAGLRTGPPPGSARRVSAGLSRIPSLRAPASISTSNTSSSSSQTKATSQRHGLQQSAQSELAFLGDTTALDDNGDLMQVAPPRGLFNHDLSFSVDHQAFVDESAIADLSTVDKVKQFAGISSSKTGESQTSKSTNDLPDNVLTDPSQFAVIIDVDEALGVVPSRLKDVSTIRLEGSLSVRSETDLLGLEEGLRFVVEGASTAQTKSIWTQQAEKEVQALQEKRRTVQAIPALVERRGSEDLDSHLLALERPPGERSLSTESIPTPVKHSLPSPAIQLLNDDPLATPTRKKSPSSASLRVGSNVGDATVIHTRDSPETPAPASTDDKPRGPVETSPQSPKHLGSPEMQLASPLLAPLSPRLVKVLRKRATSDDRSLIGGTLSTSLRLPSSPPQLGVGRISSADSDGSVASLGSGQKRAEWLASGSTIDEHAGAADLSSIAERSAVGLGFRQGHGAGAGAADWTIQDLSISPVGDQSLSHGRLSFTIHEASVEVVPTLRNEGVNGNEELRIVKKVICPAWPRAELEGRLLPVPSVALIMPEADEVVSVWCDHGRLKWTTVGADEADFDLSAGSVLVRVELPASLRNSRTQDACKLEVRIASQWSASDARKLKDGKPVSVQIPVLNCAVGTMDLRFGKPADGWPIPDVQVKDFRTQRPADVKAYLSCDEVHTQRPIEAQLRFNKSDPTPSPALHAAPPPSQPKQSDRGSTRYHIVIAVLVLLLATVSYQLTALQGSSLSTSRITRPAKFAPHLGRLARESGRSTTVAMSPPGERTTSAHASKAQETPRDFDGPSTKTAVVPSDQTAAAQPSSGANDTKAENNIHGDDSDGTTDPPLEADDAAHSNLDDEEDDIHIDGDGGPSSLSGSPDDLPTIWQRALQYLVGLLWWVRPA